MDINQSIPRAHLAAVMNAFKAMLDHPFASVLSLATIVVALSIPGLFLTIQQSLNASKAPLSSSLNINLFMKMNTRQNEVDALAKTILSNEIVNSVNVISSDQALEQFRQAMGFTDTLDKLVENPLPAVIEVITDPQLATHESIHDFGEQLKQYPLVDQMILDQQWVDKVMSVYALASAMTLLLGLLFAALLSLVMVNTLRLEIIRRQEEIEVIKLVGGTDGYIIMPFIYYSLILSIVGAAGALVVIQLSLTVISPLIRGLMPEYALPGVFSLGKTLWLVPVISLILGAVSAWIAVKSGLRHIEMNS